MEPFRTTLAAIPGLVPLAVDRGAESMTWGDIGRFPLRQAFYDWGLRECHASVGIRSIIQSSIKELDEDELIPDALMPAGFVFHMSRCGSSVLVRALSHGERNLVISEPEPLNQLLFFLSDNLSERHVNPAKVRMLRNMVLAFGRKRQLSNTHFFFKFSSWNVLLAKIICDVFPRVPSIFLYRNPEEVMVSIAKSGTGFSQAKKLPVGEGMSGRDRASLNMMSEEQYTAAVLARMIDSAIDCDGMHFLNYQKLQAEYFPLLLEFFDAKADSESLKVMKKQFGFDAKDPDGMSRFEQDAAAKRAAVTPAIHQACESLLAAPYRAIKESGRNIIA